MKTPRKAFLQYTPPATPNPNPSPFPAPAVLSLPLSFPAAVMSLPPCHRCRLPFSLSNRLRRPSLLVLLRLFSLAAARSRG